MRRCRLAFAALGFLVLATPSVRAQGLRSKINQLFIFGSGDDPLFLSGSADPSNPASIRAHGAHFIPSAVSQNGSLISFLTTAIAAARRANGRVRHVAGDCRREERNQRSV